MLAQIKGSADEGQNWTDGRVATASMANDFVFDSIFLSGKAEGREGSEGDSIQVHGVGGCGEGANTEGDIC